VIGVSVVIFSSLLMFQITRNTALDHLAQILIKIPLLFPVAGLAYEAIKLAGKKCDTSWLARALSAPGMRLQKITAREPDDAQLEIALLSIRKTLWREAQGEGTSPTNRSIDGHVEIYGSAADIDLPLGAGRA